MANKTSPLHKIFTRQQPKVAHTTRKANLLKTFAQDDLEKLSQIIVDWLNEDEKRKNSDKN